LFTGGGGGGGGGNLGSKNDVQTGALLLSTLDLGGRPLGRLVVGDDFCFVLLLSSCCLGEEDFGGRPLFLAGPDEDDSDGNEVLILESAQIPLFLGVLTDDGMIEKIAELYSFAAGVSYYFSIDKSTISVVLLSVR